MSLAEKSNEDYVQWVYEEVSDPWSVIVYGVFHSMYEGVMWWLRGGRRREVEGEEVRCKKGST